MNIEIKKNENNKKIQKTVFYDYGNYKIKVKREIDDNGINLLERIINLLYDDFNKEKN